MQEFLDRALDVLRALLRFRWTVLLSAWLVATVAWTVISQLPEFYHARARISIDSNEILEPLLQGIAIQPDVDNRVALMSQTLLNRPNLERLMRMSGLEDQADTDLERELLVDGLGRNVRLEGSNGNTSLYTLSYAHEEPDVARRVVQSLITIFVDGTRGNEREDNENAQRFLDRQIVDYEGRLLAAERRLSAFKRENAGKMPGESGGYYQRLSSMTSTERSARLELREAEQRLATLRRQLGDERPTIPESDIEAGGATPLDTQLRAQSGELADLLVRYTERHPRVSQLRESIKVLEERKALEERSLKATPSYSLVPNPVYQELRSLLAEAEARVSELRVRVAEYGNQVSELEATIDSIPKVEAELQELDRDYAVVKDQYETLLGRRESARISERVEQNPDEVKFRVIDPPFVPSQPQSSKALFTAVALAAGFGSGGALAFALSVLWPVFYTAEMVAARTGLPVIGTVSRQRVGHSRLPAALDWIAWITLALLLVAAGALIAAFQSDRIGLEELEPLLQSPLGPLIESTSSALLRIVEFVGQRVGGLLGGDS